MKFSLIVPTLNRVQEVERLFKSLERQDYTDFEVIVVDQNTDERLVGMVKSYSERFPILHIRESKKGQSHARNVGFRHVQGDIVAFPDDDCIYTEGLLTNVARFFRTQPKHDGLITRIYDLEDNENAFEFCGDNQSQELDYTKAYQVGISCALFFRKEVTETVAFDENLGPGSGTRWACGDDTDYVFRCLDKGYKLFYDATLIVRHPNPHKKNKFRQHIGREYGYGIGKGYFLATHKLPPYFLKYERGAPYQNSWSAIVKGYWQKAAYFFVNGIGTSRGYWFGLKKSQ